MFNPGAEPTLLQQIENAERLLRSLLESVEYQRARIAQLKEARAQQVERALKIEKLKLPKAAKATSGEGVQFVSRTVFGPLPDGLEVWDDDLPADGTKALDRRLRDEPW